MTWTKDGKALTSNEILEVKYKNGTATVTIKEVFPEDAGRYSCKATNTKGSVETSSKIKVIPMAKKTANGATNGAAKHSGGAGNNFSPEFAELFYKLTKPFLFFSKALPSLHASTNTRAPSW